MCISQMHAAKQQDLARIGPDKQPGTEDAKFRWEEGFFCKCSAKTNYMFYMF